jgi:hypothetical protein
MAALMSLRLVPASKSRSSGEWSDDDYDVFDGEKVVGRIYRENSRDDYWFWGLAFNERARPTYGRILGKREDAMAAFKTAYEAATGN